jgi:hypothetical protein
LALDAVTRKWEVPSYSSILRQKLSLLQHVLRSTVRLKAQTAVLQTARMAYSKALQASLPSVLEQAQASETLKFN